jgi:hypothetical protein
MARPKNGYFNAAGQPVPGTHDPISRYMDQTALKIWAHKQGLAGLPLYQRAAIDIGSTVHGMAELDLKGRPDREIEAYCHQCLAALDHLRKAFSSFAQFRAWRQQCHVRAIAQENPMVSETWQYGGTPDTIAMINGGLGLLDFKTSPKPYPDHLVALAAHGRLWEENNPQHPLASFHLICLPKDGSDFAHHAYANLDPQWELFKLWLDAYRLEKGCTLAKTAKAARAANMAGAKPVDPFRTAAVPPPKPPPATEPRRATRKSTPSEVERFLAAAAAAPKSAPVIDRPIEAPTLITRRAESMTEILRAYGHVPR